MRPMSSAAVCFCCCVLTIILFAIFNTFSYSVSLPSHIDMLAAVIFPFMFKDLWLAHAIPMECFCAWIMCVQICHRPKYLHCSKFVEATIPAMQIAFKDMNNCSPIFMQAWFISFLFTWRVAAQHLFYSCSIWIQSIPGTGLQACGKFLVN